LRLFRDFSPVATGLKRAQNPDFGKNPQIGVKNPGSRGPRAGVLHQPLAGPALGRGPGSGGLREPSRAPLPRGRALLARRPGRGPLRDPETGPGDPFGTPGYPSSPQGGGPRGVVLHQPLAATPRGLPGTLTAKPLRRPLPFPARGRGYKSKGEDSFEVLFGVVFFASPRRLSHASKIYRPRRQSPRGLRRPLPARKGNSFPSPLFGRSPGPGRPWLLQTPAGTAGPRRERLM